jgi:hypothetical protein
MLWIRIDFNADPDPAFLVKEKIHGKSQFGKNSANQKAALSKTDRVNKAFLIYYGIVSTCPAQCRRTGRPRTW